MASIRGGWSAGRRRRRVREMRLSGCLRNTRGTRADPSKARRGRCSAERRGKISAGGWGPEKGPAMDDGHRSHPQMPIRRNSSPAKSDARPMHRTPMARVSCAATPRPRGSVYLPFRLWWRVRANSLRCLCFLIFLRRFLITLPNRSPPFKSRLRQSASIPSARIHCPDLFMEHPSI
jgi:hypothetical protein